tara:strand:- start:5445 stop:6827 length:1383 start_codon:yes stop_codon:yes gene_type:complete
LAECDILVIGTGPGGYVAAIRAAQLGMKTIVLEKDSIGGVCLNWGCIPSKALLRNAEVLRLVQNSNEFGIEIDNFSADFGKAISRSRDVVKRLTSGVEFLLKKNNVTTILGTGQFNNEGVVEILETGETIHAINTIIATGARPRHIPSIPIDGKIVITSKEALQIENIPENTMIIGGGAIGCEFADVYSSYGSNVTIVEMLDHLLPLEDEEISQQLERSFKRKKIKIKTGTSIDSVKIENDQAVVSFTDSKGAQEQSFDRVLLSVGIQANSDNLGLANTRVETERDYIIIDDNMQTTHERIFAIGDVTGKLPLAHVASSQAVNVVEHIAGLNPPPLDYNFMPRATYCSPQVASIGITESQAKDLGKNFSIGRFPLSANGKALGLGESSGFIKLILDEDVGEILGAHIIGAEATELLGEIAITKFLEGTNEELGFVTHPHPTISEALKEAALDATNQAIHI